MDICKDPYVWDRPSRNSTLRYIHNTVQIRTRDFIVPVTQERLILLKRTSNQVLIYNGENILDVIGGGGVTVVNITYCGLVSYYAVQSGRKLRQRVLSKRC